MADKKRETFRDFGAGERPSVRELYRQAHANQTLGFVLAKKAEYLPPRRRRMGVWEALEALDDFVDQSDPDLDLPQIDLSASLGLPAGSAVIQIQTDEATRAPGVTVIVGHL